MKFIAIKTRDGVIKGKIAFYCRALNVSRQGFYRYLEYKNKPWKYESIATMMREILEEDEYNDCYGRKRMQQALEQRVDGENIEIPKERTIYRIMERIGINKQKKRKPHGLTKADKNVRKADDLLKRDFKSEEPLTKGVTDMTEIKGKDGKLYISAIFDCYDAMVLSLAMDVNMRAELCVRTLENLKSSYPEISGMIVHSDRGSQYTSAIYKETAKRTKITQSMNSDGGRCHDNARCESMWARMKEELFYNRQRSEDFTVEELKTMVWRYFMSYWNNRRVCSSNDGLPPIVKRTRYYEEMMKLA